MRKEREEELPEEKRIASPARSYGRSPQESNPQEAAAEPDAVALHARANAPREVRRRALEAHLSCLSSCKACPNVFGNAVVVPIDDARIMLVGQAPGSRELVDRRPFAFTAGKRLFSWFATLGVTEARFRSRVFIAAVIRCFPGKAPAGGDRVPDAEEISRCGHHLDRELVIFKPELVIAVGALACRELLGDGVLSRVVGRMHQAARAGVAFDVIALPHPSGRSTWLNRPEHARLLRESLSLIERHRAFRYAFISK